jgi:cupin fold WbuC family metalloprotein
MKLLTTELLQKLCSEATASPRKRKNYNFHKLEEPVQRFLNAMQPGTYVIPHKHAGLESFEFYTIVQGSVGVIVFGENGEIKSTHKLSAKGPQLGIEISGEVFHTVVCLEPDTVALEVKEGPYNPKAMKFFLPGFPDELEYLQAEKNSEIEKKVGELLNHWKQFFK